MERKLASIQVVDSIEDIEGSDKIVKIKVMGWSVVTRKGEFKPKDRCVFFEIGSVLPDNVAWSEFLKTKKYRIKTCKIRGVLSQGLVLPIDILGENADSYEIGDDVTKILRVVKYEQLNQNLEEQRIKVGNFPTFIHKTNEIRIQSALGMLEELKGFDFYYSTKYDGASGTFFNLNDKHYVCSRNVIVGVSPRDSVMEPIPNNCYTRVSKRYNLECLPNNFAVQGEVCGPKLQGNKLKLKEHDLFVFDVYDMTKNCYLDYSEFLDFCETWSLQTVEIERIVFQKYNRFDVTLENFLTIAAGCYPNTDVVREGIVVRPLVERKSSTLGNGRFSFKVINNDYLVKNVGQSNKKKEKMEKQQDKKNPSHRITVVSCRYCPMLVEEHSFLEASCKLSSYYGSQPNVYDSAVNSNPPPDLCPLRLKSFNLIINNKV
jgi:RNA ligase (TIGR02306 family)